MSDEIHNAYANSVSVTLSVYDLTLYFGTQSAVAVGGDKSPMMEMVDRCHVHMSPQHAKALAALLVSNIIKYEAQHGIELPLPASVGAMWSEHIKP